MKFRIRVMLLSLCIIVLGACTKAKTYKVIKEENVTIIKNNGKPADQNLAVNFKKELEISCEKYQFKKISFFDINKSGEIFIADGTDQKITKISKDGKLLKTFGKKGNGPGEFIYFKDLFVTKDDLVIYDISTNKLNIFDFNGNFQNSYSLDQSFKPMGTSYISNRLLTQVFSPEFDEKSKSLSLVTTIASLTNAFKEDKKYHSLSTKMDLKNPAINPLDAFFVYTSSKEKLYFGEISESFFKINFISFTTQKKNQITMPYMRSEISPELKKILEKAISTNGKAQNQVKHFYNKAINGLWFDNNYLWSIKPYSKSDNKSTVFQLFKDGIFQNEINADFNLKVPEGVLSESMILKNKKAYVLTEKDGEDVLEVYKITYL